MGDTSGCQISSNNLAVYIQGVSVTPSSNMTSEYFVTGSLPSSASTKRVWSFTTQGTISGTQGTLILDYTEAKQNCPLYNITFEDKLNGTFTVKNQVFSANKFISYQFDGDTILTLTLKVPKTILNCFGTVDPLPYYFTVYINDACSSTVEISGTGFYTLCIETCTAIYETDGTNPALPYLLTPGLGFAYYFDSSPTVLNFETEYSQVCSGTPTTSLLYYDSSQTNYVQSNSTSSNIFLLYNSTFLSNWGVYCDYTLSSNLPSNGTFNFNSSQFNIDATTNSDTLSFSLVTDSNTPFDVVVGNISSGSYFYVQSTVPSGTVLTVNVYDISGNGIYYEPTGSVTTSLYYTGNAWSIT
jgi:hypothetical protein